MDNRATRWLVNKAFRSNAICATDFEFLSEEPYRWEEVAEFVAWLAGDSV